MKFCFQNFFPGVIIHGAVFLSGSPYSLSTCSGLRSGDPCSLKHSACSVFKSLLWRYMFIDTHVQVSTLEVQVP